MLLQIFKGGRADSFSSRMQRARNEGYYCGFRESKLFKLAAGESFTQGQAFDWLSNVVDEGREELTLQHASEHEIEAWDLSCRIAFLLEIAPRRRGGVVMRSRSSRASANGRSGRIYPPHHDWRIVRFKS